MEDEFDEDFDFRSIKGFDRFENGQKIRRQTNKSNISLDQVASTLVKLIIQ